MSDTNYRPSGELQGDSKAMPDKGTGTGFTGTDPQTGGMSTDSEATNSMGGMGKASKSDAMDQCFAKDPK